MKKDYDENLSLSLAMHEFDYNAKLKEIELARLEFERKKMVAVLDKEDKQNEEKRR